jgi:hypothetical protein
VVAVNPSLTSLVLLLIFAPGCTRHRAGNPVGKWTANVAGAHRELVFTDDGSFDFTVSGVGPAGRVTAHGSGSYTLVGTTLALTADSWDFEGNVPAGLKAKLEAKAHKAEVDQVDFSSPDEFKLSFVDDETGPSTVLYTRAP